MLTEYRPLPVTTLLPETDFAQPQQALRDRVGIADPALDVMTDFSGVSAVIIRPGDTVDEANRRMIQRKVAMLLVVNEERHVVGIITANDVLGEKPLQVITQRGGRRGDITVRDIMTPQDKMDVLRMSDVRTARVGNILATLRLAGRHHALVADVDAGGRQRLRGTFSVTQIARQLGGGIQPPNETARTFSEIEALLAGSRT
jgi:CBS-domain-containing membrane protein